MVLLAHRAVDLGSTSGICDLGQLGPNLQKWPLVLDDPVFECPDRHTWGTASEVQSSWKQLASERHVLFTRDLG